MEKPDKRQQKILDEIKVWAQENGNQISYSMLLDLLQNENQPFSDNESIINQTIRELIQEGIDVEPMEDGDSYPAQSIDPETFIPALVNISQITMNVSSLMERLFNNEIDLSPVFQRKKDLWDDTRQSRLIESLMLRIPIPTFYFDAAQEGEWRVIDGLQRLTAFKNFLLGYPAESSVSESGSFKRAFTGLQYLTEFNGKTFDELPRQYVRRIKEAQIFAFCVQKGTPETVVYNIFQRINTGGLQLEPQEIRNAMYHGASTELANALAQSREFLETTMYSIKPDRMMDQEYIIRFMAFTELDYVNEYKGNIDAFLIKAMKEINHYDKADLQRIENNFYKVMKYSGELFGRFAFRRISEGGRRGPINKALFELFSVCFSELSEKQLDKLICQKEAFLKGYAQLFGEKDFNAAIRSGTRTECVKRINRGRHFIEGFL